MQLRRFGSKPKRTWYDSQSFRGRDYAVLALAILLFALTLWLFKVNDGRFYNPFK